MESSDILVTEAELHRLTGYKLPTCQLRELKRQGFFRARRNPVAGRVVLERTHYDAVCSSASRAVRVSEKEPQLKSQRSKDA